MAEYILKQNFDGIYYSPHPDAKNERNTLIEQANEVAQKISPHFNFNDAYGSRLDPMLVVFENQKTEKVIKFLNENEEVKKIS